MPGQLHYVASVRLIADPYDRWLWHFSIMGKRYDLRARAGAFALHAEDGTRLGVFDDESRAIGRAREHARMAHAERIPAIPSYPRAVALR